MVSVRLSWPRGDPRRSASKSSTRRPRASLDSTDVENTLPTRARGFQV